MPKTQIIVFPSVGSHTESCGADSHARLIDNSNPRWPQSHDARCCESHPVSLAAPYSKWLGGIKPLGLGPLWNCTIGGSDLFNLLQSMLLGNESMHLCTMAVNSFNCDICCNCTLHRYTQVTSSDLSNASVPSPWGF